MKVTTERISPQVLDINVEFKNRGDLNQWFLLSSDRHWDNPHSDWKLQKKHLDQARERNAKVLDFGDLFCVMQGKYDRRASKSNVRPEHQNDNYLDSVVNTAVDWFSPYADMFALISEGNHESAIRRNHETDLIERFVSALNYKNDTHLTKGLYTGWVRFRFIRTSSGKKGTSRVLNLNYTHGYGGGGPVTKGVIQANRKSVYLPDADFCVSGHIHEHWLMTQPRERIAHNGRCYIDEQVHVCLPTYKEEYLIGQDFHRERGRPPKPLGAYWIRFYMERDDVKYEFIRAK
tara:strand:- start:572 stop:1441 length:870 start_codon:yes stop_codon:yes gene_type:complete